MPRSDAPRALTRRGLIAGGLGLGLLAGCRDEDRWNSIDVSGVLPDLSFTMTRAGDGKTVTEQDYRGRDVMLFFGYTLCPGVCPLTMANVAQVLDRLGPAAEGVSVLFVTVDPDRDTPGSLARYVATFDPRVDGLRGTPNQIEALTRRYRVTHKVQKPRGERPYTVIHGPSVYVFDAAGRARFMVPKFYTAEADIDAVTQDMRRLIDTPIVSAAL